MYPYCYLYIMMYVLHDITYYHLCFGLSLFMAVLQAHRLSPPGMEETRRSLELEATLKSRQNLVGHDSITVLPRDVVFWI